MKLSLLVAPFVSFSLASAAALYERNETPAPAPAPTPTPAVNECVEFVTDAISDITDQTNNLNDVVGQLTENDFGNMIKLIIDSNKLVGSVNDVTERLKECPDFSQEDILTLSTPLLGLQGPVEQALNTIIKKKGTFDHAILGFISVSSIIKANVQKLKDAVDGMSAELRVLSPAELQPIVDQVGETYDNLFDNALEAYAQTSLFNHPGSD